MRQIDDYYLTTLKRRPPKKLLQIVNQDWVICNHVNKRKEFNCDYVSFLFKNSSIRYAFLKKIEAYYGLIPIHLMSYTSFDRFKIPSDQFICIIESNQKKRDCYLLHFPGRFAAKVEAVLFEKDICHFLKKNKIELQRLDYNIDIDIDIDIQNEKNSKSLDDFESLKEDFFGAILAQSKENLSSNLQQDIKVKTEQTKAGWTLYISDVNGLWKIRIYWKNGAMIVRFELQMNKTLLNKATFFWQENNAKEFLRYVLNQFSKKTTVIANSKLTNVFLTEKINYIKSWSLSLIEQNENLVNKSVVGSITCFSNLDFTNKFLLETDENYPAFLAIYKNVIEHVRLKDLNFSRFKRNSFTSAENAMTFTFSIDTLLETIGWNTTPHYRKKIIKSLTFLQSYLICTNNLKSDKKTSSYYFIYNFTTKKNVAIFSVNMKIFELFMGELGPFNYKIYSNILQEFYKKSTTQSKTKTTFPNYFYGLITQLVCATKSHIFYTGNLPLSGSAKKDFEKLLTWLIYTEMPKYFSYNPKKIIRKKEKNKISFFFEEGSFSFDLSKIK